VVGLVGLVWLILIHHLFGSHPVLIGVQVATVLLMPWARKTFGIRSFHASASTSEGGLVTSGPYRYWRHPIYAVRANVRASADHLRRGSEILEDLIARDGLLVVGAEYSLESGEVELFDGLT